MSGLKEECLRRVAIMSVMVCCGLEFLFQAATMSVSDGPHGRMPLVDPMGNVSFRPFQPAVCMTGW